MDHGPCTVNDNILKVFSFHFEFTLCHKQFAYNYYNCVHILHFDISP